MKAKPLLMDAYKSGHEWPWKLMVANYVIDLTHTVIVTVGHSSVAGMACYKSIHSLRVKFWEQ